MPTIPSVAAVDLASRLKLEGHVNVTGRTIESWRARGLLGAWSHLHRGGPGSVSLPGPDALPRARVAARLLAKDRSPATVTLVAMAFGAPVGELEVRLAVAAIFEPVLKAVRSVVGPEPADRADALLSQMSSTRRGGAALRRRARELTDSPDPQRPPSGDRSASDRAHDAFAAILSALDGDPTWLGLVLEDSLRLNGMGDLAHVLESHDLLDDDFARDVEHTTSMMIAALHRLDEIRADDITAVQAIFTAQPDINRKASSLDRISDAGAIAGLVANSLLSQLAMPGQLRDGLLESWRGDHDTRE